MAAHAFVRPAWCRSVSATVCLTTLATVVLAVADDKAIYVGGTSRDFSRGESKVEGRIDTTSETEFVFDAGGKGTLRIPYKAIAGLAYGLEPHGMTKGAIFLFTWDPFEQYTNKRHFLLSIRYLDRGGSEQGAVFELGKKLVRPTLATLEAQTGQTIEFVQADACLAFQSPEKCGHGTPAELRALRKVFVDVAAAGEHRGLIVAEIAKGQLGLELLPGIEGAEVVLRFHGEEFRVPDHLQAFHGGRGEALVVREGRFRPVVVFTGTRMRPWGDKPATKFAAAFVEAYRQANRP